MNDGRLKAQTTGRLAALVFSTRQPITLVMPKPAPISDVVHEWQWYTGHRWAGCEDFAHGVCELDRDGLAVAEDTGVVVELG